MAGRVASPRCIDGDEGRAVAVDADRRDVGRVGQVQSTDGADDRRPPGARILLRPAAVVRWRPADIPRCRAPAAGHRPRTSPALTSVVPRSRPRNAVRVGGHRGRPPCGASVASSRATTASAVATSVTSVRTIPARSAPRIGRTLPSPAATPIAAGTRPRRRASNAITRSRSAGQTNWPSRSNGATRTSPTASAVSSSCSIASPTSDALHAGPPIPNSATSRRSQRSRSPGPRHARRARSGSPRHRRARAPSGRGPGRRAHPRPGGTAHAPAPWSRTRRTTGRP